MTPTTAYRYYRFKFADNWGGPNYMGVRRIELQNTNQISARKQVVLTNMENGLTSGKFPLASTDGRLIDSNFTFSNNTFVFSNDVNFDGNIIYNDTYWDDISLPVGTSGKPGSKPPVFDEAQYEYYFEDQAVAGNEQYVFAGSKMPHGWKLGTDIKCHIHAHPSDTFVGDYNFELCYQWTNVMGVEDTPTCVNAKQTTDGTANKIFMTNFGDFNGVGKTLSSTLEFRLKRLSASATDTYTGNVYVSSLGCHYQIDSPGSRQTVVK